MKKTILNKINREIKSGIRTEAQVVYLLVEVKKILELELEKCNNTLSLFRNWAVHTELKHRNTISGFENRFSKHIIFTSKAKDVGKNILLDQKNFFKLEELKNELKIFLEQKGLTTKLTDEKYRWSKFKELLLEIAQECRIQINGKEINSLSVEKDSSGRYTYRLYLNKKFSDGKNVIKIKL
jgi:hypothetical protein